MKIAMCASEAVPFAKTGGLADVVGALPVALEELGEEVVIVMPGYKTVNSSQLTVHSAGKDISYAVIGRNIKVYFIKKDEYFKRDFLYGDKSGDYKDNLERFSYYCKRTLQLLKEIDFKPDIIHLHDWQASPAAVYLKTTCKDDVFYKGTRAILTIHNIGYQGLFPKEEFPKLGLDWSLFNIEGLEFYGKINLLKGGMEFSDLINTVSPTYSKEIQTSEFGFGLEGVLGRRRDCLFGILNGLDYSIWDPARDKFIARDFSLANLADKSRDKADLQKLCRLPVKKDLPLLGMVSRLAEQKGLDILAENLEKICKLDLQLVILGTGDLKYHVLLESMAKKYPKVISLNLGFDDPLAHKIYAGADIFLMPSRYEPCGLGQMISLKYAAIPLVFKTGGLADTVNSDNGFVFDQYTKEGLLKTIRAAIKKFSDQKAWMALMRRAIQCDFSWKESARQYVELYARAKKK